MTTLNPSHRIILLVVSLLLYLCFAVNLQCFRIGLPFLQSIWSRTGGWITITLSGGLIAFVIIIGVWLVGFGRLSTSSLGFIYKNLPFATFATISIWIIIQVVSAAICLIFYHHLTAASPTFLRALPLLLGQLLGNSLLEESIFRGYLIPHLRPYLRNSKWLAVIASAVLFGLSHIPWFIATGRPFYYLIPITVGGVLFGLLYVKTQNLWLCIGIHSLIDAPTQIWGSSDVASGVPILVGLLFIVFARPNPALNSDPACIAFRSLSIFC